MNQILSFTFNECLKSLSGKIVTPCYLFSEHILRDNWRMISDAFSNCWSKLEIAYSYKTNPLMKICSILHECGAWAEVTSGHELGISARLNPPGYIFNGIYKTEIEMRMAAKKNAIINLDGKHQINEATRIAHEIDSEMRVGLRIKSNIASGAKFDRFGFEYDITNILELSRRLVSNHNVKLCSLHIHIGTNVQDFKAYEKASFMLGELCNRLQDRGIQINYLDLGGGFISHTDKKIYDKYAEAICSGLNNSNVSKDVTLIIEPGRSLVENSGVLIVKILEVRTGSNYMEEHAIIDAGINSIMGTDLVENREIIALPKSRLTKENRRYSIMGPLCAERDIIVEKVMLPVLKRGDVLYFPNSGAYDLSTSYPFSRLRPSVYLHTKNGEFKRIRREEKTEDILRLELNNSQ